MKIEEIQLESFFSGREELTICALQLNSPFPSSLQVTEAMGNKILSWAPKKLRKNQSKLNVILENIKKLVKTRNIDILVLPEYYCDITFKHIIQDFSSKTNIIVVFNYYLPNERCNISSILFPDKTEYKQYKLNPSEYDRDFLGDLEEDKSILYKFCWEHKSGKSFFQILTCFDFLYLWHDTIDFDIPGIIIVPMSSSEIIEFEGIASYMIRLGDKCNINRAIVLVNCITTRKFTSKKKHFRGFCGLSQVVAHNKLRIKLPRFQEGALISSINPTNTITHPTPLNRENSMVSGEISYNIDATGDILELQGNINKGVLVNPNIIKYLGLKKFYSFYKVDKYNKVKPALRKTTLGCSGIFGVHDLLIKSYEEKIDFFKLRLSHQLGRKEELLKYVSHYAIDEIYKYRGEKLCSETGSLDNPKMPGLGDYLTKNKVSIWNILNGNVVSTESEEELSSKGFLLSDVSLSDVTPQDRNEGKDEYLIFIIFQEKDYELLTKNIQKFKTHILPSLVSDPRIRTIEFSGTSDGDQGRYGCCICHMVGYLDDIRGIVLNDLHLVMCRYEIEYGTRLVPVAENLSKSKFSSIIETSINDYDTRDTVLDLLHYLKDYPDVFVIKRLPENLLKEISKLFIEFKRWVIEAEGNNSEFASNKKRLLHNIDEFIYGFAYEINMQGKTYYDSEVFPDHSAKFINQLYKILEKILYLQIKSKANSIGKEKFLEMINSDDKCKDKKKGSLNYDFQQTTLGTTTKLISCWNKKFSKKYGHIGNDSFHHACNHLQGFTNFRNYVSHTETGSQRKLKPADLNNVFKAIHFIRNHYLL